MEYKTVRGMRDFLPEMARKKKFIEGECRKTFECYGFMPLETPAVESLELLTAKGASGEEIEKEIYSFEDKGNRKLGLRFDLTVPLARVIATNKAIAMPFKRYQIGEVFRYDRPGEKRWRSFTQADWDILGAKTVYADFEVIAIAIDLMKNLGFGENEFKVKINSRELLEEIALKKGVKKEQMVECFRSLDKLEKIGVKGVEEELKGKKINSTIIGELSKKTEELKIENSGPLEEIQKLFELLKQNKLGGFAELDLCLARGLEYYTGMVLEIIVKDSPSVGGGGRYDNLVEVYGGRATPAVGCSFGIDRLLAVLENRLTIKPEAKVFIIPVGENALDESLKIASEIRGIGVECEMDLMKRGIGKNIQYADKKGIPYIMVIGEKEIEARCFKLKELKTGKETSIKTSELKKIREIIKN